VDRQLTREVEYEVVSNPWTGRELGNHVVGELLGEGGMGAVFAGQHRFLGTRVAIKVLHGSFASDTGATQRFFQEAKASIDIGHPSVIKILDFGQSPTGELYLVMELLDGLSLKQALAANGAFTETDTVRIASAICDALAAAHAKGITHRDLKPDNVYLLRDGGVKVLDFGIAKVASTSSTQTGALLGTPIYMAPEQCRDAKLVGPHTDVYAMGVMLFEMVTGQPPFNGSLHELLAKHLFETPPRASTLVKVSPEMEALILSCLEKQPEARPSSMALVRDRLRSLTTLTMGGAITLPAPLAAMPAVPGGTTTLSRATGESLSRPPAPKRSGALVGGALLVVALAAGLAFVWRAKSTSAPPVDKPVAAVEKLAPPVEKPAVEKPPAPAPPAEKPSAPATVQVVVRSDPAGATLTVDGAVVGTTPAVVKVAPPKEVQLARDGYQPTREILTGAGEVTVKLLTLAKKPPRSSHHAPSPAATPPRPAAPSKPAEEPREGLN